MLRTAARLPVYAVGLLGLASFAFAGFSSPSTQSPTILEPTVEKSFCGTPCKRKQEGKCKQLYGGVCEFS